MKEIEVGEQIDWEDIAEDEIFFVKVYTKVLIFVKLSKKEALLIDDNFTTNKLFKKYHKFIGLLHKYTKDEEYERLIPYDPEGIVTLSSFYYYDIYKMNKKDQLLWKV